MVARASTSLLLVLAAAGLVLVLIFASQARAQSVPGVTVHIEITDAGFVPQLTEVRPGWAVQWTNNSAINHVVTSSDDDADFVFDTGLLEPGESGAFVFDMEGTFEYFSVTAPDFTGMVVVSTASSETPAAPTATATTPPVSTPTAAPTNTPTPAATTPAATPTAVPTEPTPELPATQQPSETATPQSPATAEPPATVAPVQPTPPPPSAGGAGLSAIGGTSPGLAGILLGLAVMAIAGASLLYSGSLGRIGIESPRNRRK
jgi:plastocyanin